MIKNKYLHDVNCPLCGKNSYDIRFFSTLTKEDFNPEFLKKNLKNTLDNHHKHSQIVKCKNCGVTYTNPMEDFSWLLKGYKDVVDEEYLKTETFRKILSRQHLNHIEKYHKKGKILDIGCFTGNFLEIAKQKGWDAYGIEPSLWAQKIANKRKVKIIGTDINAKIAKKDFFDVITMWDVIEHLPNPQKALGTCHKLLKKDGIIALGTPNIESFVAKVLGSNNPHLIRMHVVLYSPKTLSLLLKQTGFTPIKIYSYGRTFPVSYVLERLQLKNNLYQALKKTIISFPALAKYPIHVNVGESFTIIAKKEK